MGVSYNSRGCLSLYSILLGLLLLVQAVLAVAFFADNSWKKKLPHDDTGQAAAVSLACFLLAFGPFGSHAQLCNA